jgi:hypothetical protein
MNIADKRRLACESQPSGATSEAAAFEGCQTAAPAAAPAITRLVIMKKNASPFIRKRPKVNITAVASQVEIVLASSFVFVASWADGHGTETRRPTRSSLDTAAESA